MSSQNKFHLKKHFYVNWPPMSWEGESTNKCTPKNINPLWIFTHWRAIDVMICFSVAVFAGVVPFVFVRAEAGDALHQVVSERCLNLNYHALHSSPQQAPRMDNNVIIFYISTFAVSSILKLYVLYACQNHNKIYAFLSVFG